MKVLEEEANAEMGKIWEELHMRKEGKQQNHERPKKKQIQKYSF